jgi:rhodanese-related sulfurtransferase
VIGEQGVDKRIDVLATALIARMRVTDLENLDLAYAPQFSSAKDPVVIAGSAASNISRRDVKTINCDELQERLHRGEALQLIDVRTPEEFETSHLAAAQLVPLDELRERLNELDPQKETVVYCRVGFRGYLAARILEQQGFSSVQNLSGGLLLCTEPSRRETPYPIPNGSVSAPALQKVLAQHGTAVLDIREPGEFAYEHITGTRHVPFERLLTFTAPLPKDNEIYLLCQSGIRTAQAVKLLHQNGFSHVHSLEGGLEAWKQAGLPVEKARGPIPIMRQVQIVAGSLVLMGGLIPDLRWIAIVVGAGLLFAGCTGTCGMAKILSALPWNRQKEQTPRRPSC